MAIFIASTGPIDRVSSAASVGIAASSATPAMAAACQSDLIASPRSVFGPLALRGCAAKLQQLASAAIADWLA